MEARMRRLLLLPCLSAALVLAVQAQNPPPQDLPSAPSSVLRRPIAAKPAAPAAKSPEAKPAPASPGVSGGGRPAETAKPADSETKPGSPAGKQDSKAEAAATDPSALTITRRVDEVNVVFTVTDKHGRFVKTLAQSDIAVLDDKKPPKAVVAFHKETDLPLRVGLLIDASNSVRERFRFEQEAAIEFLNQIVRARTDKAFVLGFDVTAEITQDFSNDTEKLSHGVRLLRPGGGTALYDAVYFACRDKLLKLRENFPVRRAIILLSDGEDNQSRVTREEAIEMAQRAEVLIYTISTNVSGVKLRGDKVLERMADASGGRAFFPFKIEDVANAFSDIQEELRAQYAIAYRPADFETDGRYRSIEISASTRKYRVRARKGYYAPTSR